MNCYFQLFHWYTMNEAYYAWVEKLLLCYCRPERSLELKSTIRNRVSTRRLLSLRGWSLPWPCPIVLKWNNFRFNPRCLPASGGRNMRLGYGNGRIIYYWSTSMMAPGKDQERWLPRNEDAWGYLSSSPWRLYALQCILGRSEEGWVYRKVWLCRCRHRL